MKKKIVLMLSIISVLCVLLALSVSATRVEDYDDTFTLRDSSSIVHYQKWFYTADSTKYVRKGYTDTVTLSYVDENGNPITEVAMWEYDEEDGKYYSLVWYISDYELTWEDQTYTDDNVGTQTYPKYTAAKYTLSKVRAVDLRYYTYDGTRKCSDVPSWTENRTLKVLEGIYLPAGDPNDTADDIKLQDAVGIGRDSDNYGYVGYDAQFAATGNKIVVGNFRDCDFQCDMEGNYGTSNTWSRADNLQCLWYPDTMLHIVGGIGSVSEVDFGDGMEIIACQILRENKRVKEIVIPNSVLYLNNESFRGSDLTKLTIGENLITCPGNNAYLYTGGADVLVISKNLLNTYVKSISELIANKSATIYFDGNLEQATALMERIISENSSTYNGKITLVDYKVTQERGDVSNVCLFYNYNRCEAFYRGQHVIGVVKEFANGPLATGTCVEGCTREGCDNSTTTDIPAVFVNPGFSVPEVGDSKVILQTIAVNYDSLELYNSLYDNKIVSYGVLAGTQKKLGEVTELFDASGNVIVDGAAVANISERSEKYDLFQMKISGLEGSDEVNGAYADLALYCCGYYLTSDGTTTDSYYVSEGAITEVLPTAVSYNTVVASKK
ncbi:MAG: hypothetical protein IJ400_07550 [Clostridia bacterium]|nr:hypothetical protein [Clostridia bacterium]MBQ7761893.1 hypothetical protein [Clostridia bacterium]